MSDGTRSPASGEARRPAASGEAHRPAAWAGGRGRGWAGGRFRSPLGAAEERGVRERTVGSSSVSPESGSRDLAGSGATAAAPGQATAAAPGQATALQATAQAAVPDTGLRAAALRAETLVADWAPTAARILLGLVLAWFGYHELLQPGLWTGYVPIINEASNLAIIAVLVHGWVLLVLAVALVAGVAPRACAAIASLLLLEIVISLTVSGLSATSMRDVGVLGLAVCLIGSRNQRLVLRG